MADDLNNDGTGATAAPDTGGTNPQATTDSSSLDPKGASENGTPPHGPEQTAQQFPFPGQQDASQTQPQAPQGARDLSKAVEAVPATTQTPEVTQAVQKASGIHAVIQALAGGPRIQTTIDPQTGSVSRRPVPLTTAQAGMGVALAALTGAFNGLAERGPGAKGRAAAEGFDLELQRKQQEQKAQDEEASKTYARQAAIAQTNFTMHETAQRMAKLDYEFQKEQVADQASGLANVRAAGADFGVSGVLGKDLLPKYNITKDNALMDGVTKSIGPDGQQLKDKYGQPLWEPTYTPLDPTKKIALPPDAAQLLADHHIAGFFTTDANGKVVPKDFSGSALIKSGLYVNAMAQASAIKTTEGQLNQQLSRLPDNKENAVADVKAALGNGTVSVKALQAFAPYASMPLDQALTEMRKNKVDPQTIGQIASLIPQATQTALAKQRLDQANNDDAVRKATAKHIEDQTALPDKLREEQMKKQIDLRFAQAEAFQHESGTLNAKNQLGGGTDATNHLSVNDPKVAAISISPNDQPVNGVRQGYLDQLKTANPAMASEIQAIGEGRLIQSKFGLARADGIKLAGIVANAYPGYDQNKGEAYGKARDNFTAGVQATMNTNGRTALQHLARLYDTAGKLQTGNPISKAHVDFVADSGRAIDELNGAYTKGVLHKDDRAKYEANANSVFPENRQEFSKEGMRLLGDKIGQTQTAWGYAKASGAIADFPLLDQDSIDSYNHVLHGESAIDINGRVSKVVAKGKGSDGQMYYLDKNNNPLYTVKDNY